MKSSRKTISQTGSKSVGKSPRRRKVEARGRPQSTPATNQKIRDQTALAESTPKVAAESKQTKVLGMLRHRQGTTVAAIVKATGWKPHSVRGFFAGIVRKRLGLPLKSEKNDGDRIYRIVSGNNGGKLVSAKSQAS